MRVRPLAFRSKPYRKALSLRVEQTISRPVDTGAFLSQIVSAYLATVGQFLRSADTPQILGANTATMLDKPSLPEYHRQVKSFGIVPRPRLRVLGEYEPEQTNGPEPAR